MGFRYEYYYKTRGTTRDISSQSQNEIWLDIGSSLIPGVFDHHNSEKEYASTVDILFRETELLEETRKTLDSSQAVRIFMHENPDVDAFFSCYFLTYYLDHGEEEFNRKFRHTPLGEKLLKYVNDIDSGKGKNAGQATLYNLICHLNPKDLKNYILLSEEECKNFQIMEEALGWIRKAVDYCQENPNFNLYEDAFPIDDQDEVALKISMAMETDRSNYEMDKKDGRLSLEEISVWTKTGEIARIKAAIWNEPPRSPASAYLFARREGAVLTFVPHHYYGNNGAIISINPDIPEAADTYSLLEVAEILEQTEQIYDAQYALQNGALRRDYSKPRGREGCDSIFMQLPFSMTSQPWYVSKQGDMVDAPGVGSLIPFEIMKEILKNITHMIKKSQMISFQFNGSQDCIIPEFGTIDAQPQPISTWASKMKAQLSGIKERHYPLLLVEVDSALISHNSDILDAYFMMLSDGSYLDKEEKNVFKIDHRTHLYVNQDLAVLFAASTSQNKAPIRINGLLDWTNNRTLKSSRMVDVFSKVLYQRGKFIDLGQFLEHFKEKQKEIPQKNEELISLLARAQAYECIHSQLELDLYQFIYERLNLQRLKDSVQQTMDIVSSYTKEQVYEKLNFLSMITIPYVLLSSVFQNGIIKLNPLLDFEAVPGWKSWAVASAITIVVTAWFYNFRKNK